MLTHQNNKKKKQEIIRNMDKFLSNEITHLDYLIQWFSTLVSQI